MSRATVSPVVYRLLLPLMLSLFLMPLVQAQETQPILRCRLQNESIGQGETSQFSLELDNAAGLDPSALAIRVEYTTSTDINAIEWVTHEDDGHIFRQNDTPLLVLDFAEDATNATEIHLDGTRIDSGSLASPQGVLAIAQVRALQPSSLVTFTIPATWAFLYNNQTDPLPLTVEENCFLAIGGVQLPTATTSVTAMASETATATATETGSSVLPSPTATITPTPTPTTVTGDPAVTPTPSPTETIFVTPTPTPTATVLIFTTPTDANPLSPLATPAEPPTQTPTDVIFNALSTTTPDIALTLTAEALSTLLPLEPPLEIPTLEGLDTLPADEIPPATPTPTATAIEVLSPPRLEDTFLPPAMADVMTEAEVSDTVAPETSQVASLLPASAVESSAASSLPVEKVVQPAAAILPARSPILLIAGWTTFIGAVVLAFASWWLRRQS